MSLCLLHLWHTPANSLFFQTEMDKRALCDHTALDFSGYVPPPQQTPLKWWRCYPPATSQLWTHSFITTEAGIQLVFLCPPTGMCSRLTVPLLSLPVGRGGRGALALLRVVSICSETKIRDFGDFSSIWPLTYQAKNNCHCQRELTDKKSGWGDLLKTN